MALFRLSFPVVALLLAALPLRAEAPVRVPADRGEVALSFAPVVKAASPSVVSIYAMRVVESRMSRFAGDPVFERLFRDLGASRPEVQRSLGSGVIAGAEGLVVSNYHVVEDAQEITVVLRDRRELKAEVVLADRDNDLAVLRLDEAVDLPGLELADSDLTEVGDLVLAIGNPFGLDQTVSMGIISALARSSISVGDGRGYFLQTDAAINPGNSGGALIDIQGRLIGINTAIMTRSGGSNGVGFAIPSNLVKAVLAQAAAGGRQFVRPWAGVSGQAVDGALADSLGLPYPEGVILSGLHPASPFGAAGLREGDVVLKLQGRPVNSPQEMLYRLSAADVGARVAVDYLRAGKPGRAEVALIAAPEAPARDTLRLDDRAGVLEGLELMRLNPAVQEELKLGPVAAEGVVVSDVAGWSARTGLQRGDILLRLNGEAVGVPGDAARLAGRSGRNWIIDLMRGGEPLRLRFRT